MKTDLLSPYKIQSMKGRFALAVVTWMAYSAAFFPAFLKIGDAAGMLVTLPVMASAWLFGLTGGLLAAVLNILITALLFDVVGVHGLDAMIQRWPGIFAGFLIGAVTGWMSDLFYKVRRQSSELVIERDTLQKEIAERQRAEEALQKAHTDLEQRVSERTAELIRVNDALEADIAERKRAEQRIGKQVSLLSALRAIDLAITSSFDLRLTLHTLLGHAISELGVDAAVVLLFDRGSNELRFAAERGFHGRAITHLRPKLGESYAGRAASERRLITVPDLSSAKKDFHESALITSEGFVSLFAMPLIAKGEVKGVLEIFHRAPLSPDDEWMNFLEALAGQSAIAMDNAELFANLQASNQELRRAYDKTIEGWSRALDLRDKETEGHTQRVTEMTLELAERMGMTEGDRLYIRWGALLHDIGKMGVPDSVLLKSESLTEGELIVMHKHPQYAYDMLAPIAFLQPALDIPYCHHEKWDGTGYPRGLKGEAIPLAARIFAVVDVWDALCSNRPYRPAWTKEKALEHIKSLAGSDFDPNVLQVFIQLQSGIEREPKL